MAENGRNISEPTKTTVDKEMRLKILKERQNDERQKKLEEIKSEALAAQRFKEQKEIERRRRIEDLKGKEDARRRMVEERKRAIDQAEQDRLVSILRRNQEREARIESKRRNERSNIVFAFGSSTPRMLDPTDASTSYWGARRATSIQNITSTSNYNPTLTRRQSERDLDSGSKKRATSAGGLERSGESSTPLTPAGCASGYVGRRRTDLMPTVPNRDSPFATSRKSLNQSPASSRPSSSLSQQSTTSVTSSVSVRHRPSAPRRQRPASIAITGVTHELNNKKPEPKPPLPKTRKYMTKDKPVKSKASPVDSTPKISSPDVELKVIDEAVQKPPDVVVQLEPKAEVKIPEEEPQPVVEPVKEEKIEEKDNEPVNNTEIININNAEQMKQITNDLIKSESINQDPMVNGSKSQLTTNVSIENEMTTSMTKVRISTEEEAKAALAERRRLAREEAERQAEQERLRIEAEAQAELERQRREEEQVQKLVEMQRIQEQERLEEAIKEAQKKEEEEKLRREEEQRARLLKEEADKKAKEEAEKKLAEQQERLKNEEKEREARRKRVEAIMRRTRGVNNANVPGQLSVDDKNENKSESEHNKVNGAKPVEQENGAKNGKDVEIVDNIIPDETIKNANTVSIDTINSTDTINSNNTWQATQQYGNEYPLM